MQIHVGWVALAVAVVWLGQGALSSMPLLTNALMIVGVLYVVQLAYAHLGKSVDLKWPTLPPYAPTTVTPVPSSEPIL